MIITKCYGKEEKWTSREKAKEFFLDCMMNSEGSEQERYVSIYLQLEKGSNYATDEYV